jgi:hypothetical protein
MGDKMVISYNLVYSKRKTMGLIVDRDRSIVVRVPQGVTKEEIENFIERKKYWIYTKLKHPQKYQKEIKKEFISGAAILYLGRYYKLEIRKGIFDGIKFSNRFTISKNNQKNAMELFKEWYINKAKEKIIPKARFFSKNMGVKPKEIRIKEFKYRWGSCTPKNNINFNWRLMKAPTFVIDYVIVHELAHLLEANHSSRFWNIVRAQIPAFLKAKEWLKDNGHLLEVDF